MFLVIVASSGWGLTGHIQLGLGRTSARSTLSLVLSVLGDRDVRPMRYVKQCSFASGNVYLSSIPDWWILLDDRDGEVEQELTKAEFEEQIAKAEYAGILDCDGHRCQLYKLSAE